MTRDRRIHIALCCLIAVTVFAAQRNFILERSAINPDEAELLASGRRAAMSLIPFKDFTSGTYGPLWPMFLGWLSRLGLPLTLPVAHLLNALVTIGACSTLAVVVHKRWNLLAVVALVSPLVIQWSKGFSSQDFYSLSTETLPLTLLIAACLVSFPAEAISMRRAWWGALLFGAVVWTKYSFAVIVGVALVALMVKMLSSHHALRHSLRVCLWGALLPFAALVAWALTLGVPLWKTLESPLGTLNYIRSGGLDGTPTPWSQRFDAVHGAFSMLSSLAPLMVFILVVIVGGVVHETTSHGRIRRFTDIPHVTLLRLLAAASLVASVVSVAFMVPFFSHYGFLLIAGTFQATLIISSLQPVPLNFHTAVSRLALVVMVTVVAWNVAPVAWAPRAQFGPWGAAVGSSTSWTEILTRRGALWDRGEALDGRPIAQMCPRGSRAIVWGWAPELYSQYDWEPATRYVTTTIVMSGLPYVPDFTRSRPRLLQDFEREKPSCVVDAATPVLFPGWGPPQTIGVQWPEFAARLAADYTPFRARLLGYSPLTVWVRQT